MDQLDTSLISLHSLSTHQTKIIKENLGLTTIKELLYFFPQRYEDRSKIYPISSLKNINQRVQVRGVLLESKVTEKKGKAILSARLRDNTGTIKLTWFNKAHAINKILKTGIEYLLFGQVSTDTGLSCLVHPEISLYESEAKSNKGIIALYPLKKTIGNAKIDNHLIQKAQNEAINKFSNKIEETMSPEVRERYNLMERKKALLYIHQPPSKALLSKARKRLKFEELFSIILCRLLHRKTIREQSRGYAFTDISLLKKYYNEHLPFLLTGDQKRVIKDIHLDMRKGKQMNRLVQGDVGSGKTIVAFLSSLIPIASGAQVALVTPTESLANQHYKELTAEGKKLGLSIALLTGSTPPKEKLAIVEKLRDGTIDMIIGTHALLYDTVVFKKLGMAIIDEQHRFGVGQRAKIWDKNPSSYPPHILVMTATTIPRTLSMTLYGDLDVSTIREKPKNRKPIITSHYYDKSRLMIFEKIRAEIEQGRQVYIVYPRITSPQGEEIYKDVMDGYESIQRAFPRLPISILHGAMSSSSKAYEMKRFVQGETKIMVGTTILEVGINVPNATIMVIENAEVFGLAQLHQLRGRVGRGQQQSYCFLVTREKLSPKAKQRMETMIQTDNGFHIAQTDLHTRGPGDLFGLRQSGFSTLKLANLEKDKLILRQAHRAAEDILSDDPSLTKPKNRVLKALVRKISKNLEWGRVS